MDIHFLLQVSHIIMFGLAFLIFKNIKVATILLILSSLFFSVAVYFNWVNTLGGASYIVKATIDVMAAAAILFVGYAIHPEQKKQLLFCKCNSLILWVFTFTHVLTWVEYPTLYTLMYDAYSNIIIVLMLAQLTTVTLLTNKGYNLYVTYRDKTNYYASYCMPIFILV